MDTLALRYKEWVLIKIINVSEHTFSIMVHSKTHLTYCSGRRTYALMMDTLALRYKERVLNRKKEEK